MLTLLNLPYSCSGGYGCTLIIRALLHSRFCPSTPISIEYFSYCLKRKYMFCAVHFITHTWGNPLNSYNYSVLSQYSSFSPVTCYSVQAYLQTICQYSKDASRTKLPVQSSHQNNKAASTWSQASWTASGQCNRATCTLILPEQQSSTVELPDKVKLPVQSDYQYSQTARTMKCPYSAAASTVNLLTRSKLPLQSSC